MTARRLLLPAIILLVGLAASLLAAYQLAGAEQRRAETRFEALAASVRSAAANKMDQQLALLRGARGLLMGSNDVTRDDFRRYVESLRLRRNYVGILGIGFAEAGRAGTPLPGRSVAREGRSAVVMIEPMERRNRAALGLDMLSEPVRRAAMLEAARSRQPALSGKVELIQEVAPDKQPGFLLYLPVIAADGRLRGWVYSPLRGHDLFGAVFAPREFAAVRIAVHDGPPRADNRMYESAPGNPAARHRATLPLPVAGRSLSLAISSRREFDTSGPQRFALLIGALGAMVSLLFAILAFQQQRNVDRIEEEVRVRTAELSAANARLGEQSEARSTAEAQLHQVQKMEAVGQLTGGIAHDFNNMLAVVIGNLDLALRNIGDAPRSERLVRQALKGATRSATLTQRLLAYSRRQALAPAVIEPNKLVAEMSELLRRTLGELIDLETVLAGGLWRVDTDPAQLESAMLNLALNARDAMPDGGRLTIETANCHLDEAYAASHPEVEPGQYVLIALTDSGHGMGVEVRQRAFEPFYTTKGVGRGTGLGLSQVFGFVRQSGGHVKVYSEEGEGTTVKLYLPRYAGAGDAALIRRAAPFAPRGRADELILVVEDEEDVRSLSVEVLRQLGYSVIDAPNGPDALTMLERHANVQLVFSDIVMPGMNGRQLADLAAKRWPDTRWLFTTGFTRNAVVHNGRLDHGVDLLPKPFTVEQLAVKVRQMLDA